MPYHWNWKHGYHIGSLASSHRLDLLLHFEVLASAPVFHFSLFPLFEKQYNRNTFLTILLKMSSAKQFGPVLKIVVCISVLPIQLILWPVVGIVGSVLGGAAYGFYSPVFATFQAVGEGKTNQLYHCFYVCV